MGGHNLAVGMGSDFDLHDLLKPHLSPALPHNGNGQEYWQVKCERVTLKASLISPALGKPAPDRTRLLAGAQMKGAKRCPKLGGSRYPKT